MRVIFQDGLQLDGDTFEDIVQGLWDSASWDNSVNVEEYMKKVQKRAVVQTGKNIFFSNAETFVKELHRVGIITEIEASVNQ